MKKIFISLFSIAILIFSGTTIATNTQYDLIIITPDDLSNFFVPLVQHKQQHGIMSKIIPLDDIYSGVFFQVEGRDNAEKIKYFIKNSIEQWNVKYVMLVGGKDMMPVRYTTVTSASEPSTIITDLYYADIYNKTGDFCSWDSNENNIFGEMDDNNIIDYVDLNPDVCIGRILCRTESEVSTVINKIIEYESIDISSTTWFKNLIVCGGDTHTYKIVEFLLPLFLKKTGRIAFEGEYQSKQIASLLEDFNAKKIFTSKNNQNDVIKFSTENIKNAIDEGAGFLFFGTHGSTDYIATHPPFKKNVWLPSSSGYSSTDVLDLRNEEKLPIAVFCACSCGDFDTSISPIAWEFIKHVNGGSIASLACTSLANVFPGTLCTETLLGYLTKEFFQKYSEGKRILGELWKESIMNYVNNEEALRLGAPNITIAGLIDVKGPCFTNHYTMEQWMLLGDPSLMIGGYP